MACAAKKVSSFVIDMSVQASGSDNTELCPLVDRSELYGQRQVEDLLIDRASLLQSFGWQVVTIPLKDT